MGHRPAGFERRSLAWLVGGVATLEAIGQGIDAFYTNDVASAARWAAIAIVVFTMAVIAETY